MLQSFLLLWLCDNLKFKQVKNPAGQPMTPAGREMVLSFVPEIENSEAHSSMIKPQLLTAVTSLITYPAIGFPSFPISLLMFIE